MAEQTTPRQRMRKLVRRWKAAKKLQEGATNDAQASRYTEQVNQIEDRIVRFLKNHPKLIDDIQSNQDYTGQIPASGPDNPATSADDDTYPGEGAGTRKRRKNTDDDDEETLTDDDGDDDGKAQPLPGVRGKDYHIVRGPNGKQYALYKMKVAGNTINVSVRLTKKTRDALGIDNKDGRLLTKAQFKRMEVLGASDEFSFKKGDRHPFKGVVRTIKRTYKGLDILDDDEVLGLLIGQAAGVYSSEEFEGLLKSTKWYRQTTAHQRAWTLDLSPKERREQIKSMSERVRDGLEDLYGFDWQEHVKPSRVKKIAERIASGALGDPGSGFERWFSNQQDQAAGIEGTPAWIAQESEEEERRAFLNRPEDMFEELRTDMLYELGPHARLDRSTLKTWAADLVSETKSDADWDQFIRQQKKTLLPYMDQNTAWQDFASPYLAKAQEMYGRAIGFSDQLFADLTSRTTAADGTTEHDPTQAMSLFDFEKFLAQDDRFRGTKTWRDEMVNTIHQLRQSFGVAA